MSQDRKRVASKSIPIAEPKKREPVVDEPIQEQTKVKLDHKYVKVAASEKAEVFKAVGDRRQKGELGQPYYTTENDKGYFYYIVLKTI